MAQQFLRFQLAHVGFIQNGRELVPELVRRDTSASQTLALVVYSLPLWLFLRVTIL